MHDQMLNPQEYKVSQYKLISKEIESIEAEKD